MNNPRVSIVINTLNRGELLQNALNGLRCLKYDGEFEVIVVNGPSTDNSQEVIASWSSSIRSGTCGVANLSVSRNIGISMSRGDIVAFLDDDAIPEPEWLTHLTKPYSDPSVGGVGGFVYDHTGYEFQYRYCTVDRFGNADLSIQGPTPHLCFPKSFKFPHLLGCNCSFRRSALMEVGGFDEEYEYFLDETDVCVRLIDAGYLITQLPNAFVHHKYAPSNIRGENKVARYRYPIIKNKIYFMLKHAMEFHTLDRLIGEQQAFIEMQRNEVKWCREQMLMLEADEQQFELDLARAIEVGLKRGLEGPRPEAMLTSEKRKDYCGEFLAFQSFCSADRKTIVIVSRDFPPSHGGGVATFSKDLAEALAIRGNLVHVVTHSHDINRVDFENGVWIHRVLVTEKERVGWAGDRRVPQHVWNWSATALDETRRIAEHRAIDVVEAPIWDCEGAAFLAAQEWPLVTSLQTTLHFWLQTHRERLGDGPWMEEFGKPMLDLEKVLMERSHAIRSISRAIASEIEKAYDFSFDSSRLFVSPLGLSDGRRDAPQRRKDGLQILFVGRLELRKGIDVLLEAMPAVLERFPGARLRIIGDNSLLDSSGVTFMEQFISTYADATWLPRVSFEGKVDQQSLVEAYRTCDIFVAPSRFESFGLIYLEAMREGKPVIGCSVGGVPEVVSQGDSGLLVEPGDVAQLTAAILALCTDTERRLKMGAAGRELFEKRFTAKRMAEESELLYEIAKSEFLTGI